MSLPRNFESSSQPNRRLRFRVKESKGEAFSYLHHRSQAAVFTHSDIYYKEETTRPTSSPSASQTLRPASLIPPSEDKSHFKIALAAASAKPKHISRHAQGGFAVFSLVEDDLDLDKDSQLREYIKPSSPFHSPSQFPRSSPPPFFLSSPSLDAVSSHSSSSTMKPKKEKKKTDINATEIGIVTDEAKKEAVDQVQQRRRKKATYWMSTLWVSKRRRSTVVQRRRTGTTMSLSNPNSILPLSKPTTSIWTSVVPPLRHHPRPRLHCPFFKSRLWPTEFHHLPPHPLRDHTLSSLRPTW